MKFLLELIRQISPLKNAKVKPLKFRDAKASYPTVFLVDQGKGGARILVSFQIIKVNWSLLQKITCQLLSSLFPANYQCNLQNLDQGSMTLIFYNKLTQRMCLGIICQYVICFMCMCTYFNKWGLNQSSSCQPEFDFYQEFYPSFEIFFQSVFQVMLGSYYQLNLSEKYNYCFNIVGTIFYYYLLRKILFLDLFVAVSKFNKARKFRVVIKCVVLVGTHRSIKFTSQQILQTTQLQQIKKLKINFKLSTNSLVYFSISLFHIFTYDDNQINNTRNT
eukprot:TRINITY_DN12499_c0_g1_i1.p1 TRINITY_DN12499_c0_g1~~TRINITY_DN12499_c0_g1_i1.p1  ORF type:complete len:276 (-),score=-17.44 TRINITY_DN12499_c0_g1_i1:288-1115(-)